MAPERAGSSAAQGERTSGSFWVINKLSRMEKLQSRYMTLLCRQGELA